MSNLLLKRKTFTPQSTTGELWLDGAFECYTLEPPRSEHPEVKPRAIPPGTYKFTLAFSPRHKRDVPLLQDVPGFSGVEIHIGNFPKDTEGCILVGQAVDVDVVMKSTLAFEKLMMKLEDGTIEIQEEPLAIDNYEAD